jgi:hypothetical protein
LNGIRVKLSLWLTEHHAMKTYWGVDVQIQAFLISALDGSEWSVSRPGRFIRRERTLGTHWIGGWGGGPQVWDTVSKRKIPSPRRESNPDYPIIQPVASHYIYWAIPALHLNVIVKTYILQWMDWKKIRNHT